LYLYQNVWDSIIVYQFIDNTGADMSSNEFTDNTEHNQFQEYVSETQVLLTPENFINILSACSHQKTAHSETDKFEQPYTKI
jgi:hypothetical protein